MAADSNGGITLHVCRADGWRRLLLLLQLYRLISRMTPQVIVAHGAKVTSRLGILRPRNVALVGITHNKSHRLMRATHLIALTQQLRQLFVKRGYPESRIQEIPNPLPGCTSKEVAGKSARNDQILKIGTLSRLVKKKGIDVFLKGFRIALDRGLKAHAVIGGDGSEKPVLEKLCRSLNLESHVTFTGWVTEQYSFFSDIDWLCVPSRCEPFGLVALEGFRYGVPVLAAKVGGLEEIIHDGDNGLLFESDNPHALADTLLQLAAEDHQRLSQQIRDSAYASLERYKPELVAASIESALLQAIVDLQTENQSRNFLRPGHRPL